MEILTEKQQLEKKAEEVFKSWQQFDNKLSIAKNELSNYRDRLFKNSVTARAMEYEILILETATNQLYEYQASLRVRLELLKTHDAKTVSK